MHLMYSGGIFRQYPAFLAETQGLDTQDQMPLVGRRSTCQYETDSRPISVAPFCANTYREVVFN